jgi:two-component system response regulator YesN
VMPAAGNDHWAHYDRSGGVHCMSRAQAENGLENRYPSTDSEPRGTSRPGLLGPRYPYDKERELIGLVRLGDRTGAREILNEILGSILYCHEDYCSDHDFEVMKVRTLELMVVLSRAAVEGGAGLDKLLGLNFTYLQQLGESRRMEELWVWLVQILDRFLDTVYESRNIKNFRLIDDAVKYMKRHFRDHDLSLDRVAAAIHVSPFYLSHLFRDELGTTFIAYLTEIRLDEAKRLLRDTSLTVGQVSEGVGYSDPSYFSRVFKKHEKVTPARFRREF